MKGIVLLAVIHMLIIYQSKKNKANANHTLPEPPGYSVKAPDVESVRAQRSDSTVTLKNVRPEYAVFMMNKPAPAWSRNISN